MDNLILPVKKVKGLAMALFAACLFLACSTPGEAHDGEQDRLSMEKPLSMVAKIDIALKEQMDRGDCVEALVQMTEQIDTSRVAGAALRNRLFSDTRLPKLITGEAVVQALRRCASNSRQDIERYLEQEKEEGVLQEIKGYYIVNMLYIRAAPSLIEELAGRPDVKAIYPNTQISLDAGAADLPAGAPLEEPAWNISLIGAPAAWAQGIDGTGVVVGILDSGVDREHEALKTRWRGYNAADPENPDPLFNWFDAVRDNPLPEDYNCKPHGTHVAGTVLGAAPGKGIGVAPGAKWIAAAAFAEKDGSSGELTADAADLLAAAQYLLAPVDDQGTPHPDQAPHIINSSWGGDAQIDEWFRDMVRSWRDAGILPIFAAGNSGPGAGTVCNPGHYPESFAVAAVNSNSELAGFSSRGPGPYEGVIKPDISAPGVSILSSVPGGYACWSGTSMAAPHVAGAAALLIQAHPHLSVADLEQLLRDTAQPLMDSSYSASPNEGYGYGLIDICGALPLRSGDLNGNSSVDVGDAIILLRNIVGLESLTPRQRLAADVTADGQVNIADAILILRYIVGLVFALPLSAA